ncbi:MAG TPA: hypothetical protein VH088_23000 [Terriglobales bacterium]|jgi:hypothetical protein|nr:hypothetical protein [Terriglobales bacterium]
MKKIGLLLILGLSVAAYAQSTADVAPTANTSPTAASFPFERIQAPTNADLYCAGFISQTHQPDANYVAGGLNTPNTTRFVNGDLLYLSGTGYQLDKEYTILREIVDPNEHEAFVGQSKLIKSVGQPYAELARVKIVDTRNKMAIAQVEFSCDPIVPGDVAVPFVEKPTVSFHLPVRFDRFAPANAKTAGRILMAKDFDTELGTGMKVYLNVGTNQGVKTGDYFRAVRGYEADRHNEVDSLSFKASTTEDTQKVSPSMDPNFLTRTKGPTIHVADMPRRSVGEVVVLSTTPTTATGMIVFALEDVHVGDNVELDEQQ